MGTHYSIPHDCDDEKSNRKIELQQAEERQHAVHTQLHAHSNDQYIARWGYRRLKIEAAWKACDQ